MARIETPVAGYTGDGPGGIHFVDGVAETDDPAVISYCHGAGYLVDGERSNPLAAGPALAVADPREVTTTVVGSPTRDAAVDPRPQDFRPPVNAGQANPHGPEVYAPGLPGGGLQPTAPPAEPDAGPDTDSGTPRPAQAAPVADWRAYASTRAQDSDETAAIEKMTKAELITKYGN
ncbi:hypothetical protein [Actinacidiphila sp. ITFR-21]|uniref:hypothetical protein n=1 Tax=Actinacidiphila sp. ITFR-21 TaxID=3075199 RepID=UPI002889CFD3|nr:hypothetical protein [Streptomyces sp. ITFR-21]WNI16914.1 hypothetical protein RLT57_16220 [Streptomyces sp. ITFR-21]